MITISGTKEGIFERQTRSNNKNVFDILFRKDQNMKIIIPTAGVFPYGSRLPVSGENRWARHLSRIEEERNVYRVLVGKSVGKRYFEELGVAGNLIVKWILRIL